MAYLTPFFPRYLTTTLGASTRVLAGRFLLIVKVSLVYVKRPLVRKYPLASVAPYLHFKLPARWYAPLNRGSSFIIPSYSACLARSLILALAIFFILFPPSLCQLSEYPFRSDEDTHIASGRPPWDSVMDFSHMTYPYAHRYNYFLHDCHTLSQFTYVTVTICHGRLFHCHTIIYFTIYSFHSCSTGVVITYT